MEEPARPTKPLINNSRGGVCFICHREMNQNGSFVRIFVRFKQGGFALMLRTEKHEETRWREWVFTFPAQAPSGFGYGVSYELSSIIYKVHG